MTAGTLRRTSLPTRFALLQPLDDTFLTMATVELYTWAR
jgi:hypothetical protein